jgi:hypothetical protein
MAVSEFGNLRPSIPESSRGCAAPDRNQFRVASGTAVVPPAQEFCSMPIFASNYFFLVLV